jgi:hypothetical protein
MWYACFIVYQLAWIFKSGLALWYTFPEKYYPSCRKNSSCRNFHLVHAHHPLVFMGLAGQLLVIRFGPFSLSEFCLWIYPSVQVARNLHINKLMLSYSSLQLNVNQQVLPLFFLFVVLHANLAFCAFRNLLICLVDSVIHLVQKTVVACKGSSWDNYINDGDDWLSYMFSKLKSCILSWTYLNMWNEKEVPSRNISCSQQNMTMYHFKKV